MSFCPVPFRWLVVSLGFYACGIMFMQRAMVNVSIVHMTTPKTLETSNITRAFSDNHQLSDECYPEHLKFDRFNNISARTQNDDQEGQAEFDWNEEIQGVILGASFYLYCIFPPFIGQITDRFGSKWVCFVGISVSGLIALLTPIAITLGDATAFIALQTLAGAFYAFIYPSVFSLIVRWIPLEEKSNANGGMIFGGCAGSTAGSFLAGYICNNYGWQALFYFSAALHVPWMIIWMVIVTNAPSENRFISDAELSYIQQNTKGVQKLSKNIKVPWGRILTSRAVLTSVFTKMGSGFGCFLMLAKIPSYLATVHGLTIEQNGMVNAGMMGTSLLSSTFASPIANQIIRHTNLRSIVVRKAFQALAIYGPALCVALIPAQGCDLFSVLVLLFLATFLFYGFPAGEWTVISDYAPNFSGTVLGVASSIAFAMGFVAPYLAGVILNEHSTRFEWNFIFYLYVGFMFSCATIFIIFGTDQQQEWDKIPVEVDDYVNNNEKGQIVLGLDSAPISNLSKK